MSTTTPTTAQLPLSGSVVRDLLIFPSWVAAQAATVVGRFHPLAPGRLFPLPSAFPPPAFYPRAMDAGARGRTRGEGKRLEQTRGKEERNRRISKVRPRRPRPGLRSGPGAFKAPPIFLFDPSKDPGGGGSRFYRLAGPLRTRGERRNSRALANGGRVQILSSIPTRAGMSGRSLASSSCLLRPNEVPSAECEKKSVAARETLLSSLMHFFHNNGIIVGRWKNLLKIVHKQLMRETLHCSSRIAVIWNMSMYIHKQLIAIDVTRYIAYVIMWC